MDRGPGRATLSRSDFEEKSTVTTQKLLLISQSVTLPAPTMDRCPPKLELCDAALLSKIEFAVTSTSGFLVLFPALGTPGPLLIWSLSRDAVEYARSALRPLGHSAD
jgi:hypothetical protein